MLCSAAFRRSPGAVCRFHHGLGWRRMLFVAYRDAVGPRKYVAAVL